MTIRLKVTMAAIAVILVANSLLSLVGLEYAQRVWLREVQSRVRLNLNSARSDYEHHVDGIGRFLGAVALDERVAEAVGRDDAAELARLLRAMHRAGGMDFVALLDPRGRLVCRAGSPQHRGGDLSGNPIVERALAARAAVSGTTVLSAESLAKEGEALAARARFEVAVSSAARPVEEKTRRDGLIVAAAVPLEDERGELVALVFGGDLLNRRFGIVDGIKEEVFPHEPYRGREVGAVSIFQGDLRVSTTLRGEDGSREVGTQVSETVYDKVLVRGGTWSDRALVVDDWYFTAYEPIRDPRGDIVGVLGIGLLEAPFLHQRNMLMGFFLAMVVVATLASLVFVYFVTTQVLRPVGRITAMSRKVVEGDLTARVGDCPSGEMGILCRAIDSMAEAIAEREEQLRTATRQQIGQSEKLASIGRLAAGVAHEINNPLTGVLAFAHLLKEDEDLSEQGQRDLDLIVHETTRVAQIVRGLLDFARERPTGTELLDVNQIIRRTLPLLGNQEASQQIVIVEDLEENLPQVEGDVNQLQQVLLNLSLNACESMRGGGTLLVGSAAEDGRVLLRVTDTGCGIKRQYLDRIFEPFFSTKPVGKGTGLGLSVSYGIVQRHGGTLEVETAEDKGTTFTVVLPSADGVRRDRNNGKVNR